MKSAHHTRFSFYCFMAIGLIATFGCRKTAEAKADVISTDTQKDCVVIADTIRNDSLKTDIKAVTDSVAADTTFQASEDSKQKPSGFEPHAGFVLVRDYVPDVIEDIRYSTNNNFMGAKAEGYEANAAIISKQAAIKLKEAADEFREMGYVIKIYDAYRPQQAVDHFVRWAQGSDQQNKKDYYPTIEKQNLFPRYIAKKSGHSKGSTVDLTICHKDTKEEVDMGSHFDYFGPPSHTDYQGSYPGGNVNKTHNKNRLMLKQVMERHGFTNYANEWWHYTLNNQPYPNTYFNFPVTDK